MNPSPSRVLGIFGLSVHTTDAQVRQIFSKFGIIDRLKLVYDTKTGRSRGFAFVYYQNTEDARAAKDQCAGMEIDRQRIRVDFSLTARAHSPTPGVYMGKPTREFAERDRDLNQHSHSYDNNTSYRRRRSPSPQQYRHRRRNRSASYSPRIRKKLFSLINLRLLHIEAHLPVDCFAQDQQSDYGGWARVTEGRLDRNRCSKFDSGKGFQRHMYISICCIYKHPLGCQVI